MAVLTPPGVGALATVAVHGPDAWELVRRVFRRPTRDALPLPADPERGRFWLGWLSAETPGETGDQVIVVAKGSPPGCKVEIHCHGGREVLRLILDTLGSQGVRPGPPGDEHLAGTPSPGAVLARALTLRTAAIALDQQTGACARAIDALLAALEEGRAADAFRQMEELASRIPLGRHIDSPWRVALLGPPNVGKSSIMNALVGYRRSIVAPFPGTTRDVATALVALDGWPVELSDTAGLRAAQSSLEQQGVERAVLTAADCDLRLWILDATGVPVEPPPSLAPVQIVINKTDLKPTCNIGGVGDAVLVSARTGSGLETLAERISARLVPAPPPPGAPVPLTAAAGAALVEALRLCRQGDLGAARQVLGEIRPPESSEPEARTCS